MNIPVLIVTEALPPVYGGADIAAYRYFVHLKSVGANAMLLGTHNVKWLHEPHVYALRVITLSKFWKRWGGFYIRFVFLFLRASLFLLRNRQLRVVHMFNAVTPIVQATALAAKLLNRKVIMESSLRGSDDPQTILNRNESVSRWLSQGKYLRRKIFCMADAYVSKSAFLSSTFKHTDIPASKVHEIPYAVNTELYKPLSKQSKNQLREKLGLPQDRIIICFVGGINKRKGAIILAEAFVQCYQHNPNVFLALVGPMHKYDQYYVGEIKQCLQQVEPDAYIFSGQVSNTYEWMQASDVFVLPSFREGFPISVLEALCTGLIVVASDIPEIKDVQIRHSENGFLFTTGSVGELETQLRQILLNFEQLRDTSSIVAESGKRYGIKQVAQQYNMLYESLF